MQRIARYMTWPGACTSVTILCSIETVEWIELVFHTDITIDVSYTAQRTTHK